MELSINICYNTHAQRRAKDLKKSRWLWLILFILITGLTIWAIVSQSSSFDFKALMEDLRNANKLWLILAFISMFANIFFEALAIRAIIRKMSPIAEKKRRYLLYSSADNYFSAITPFTSGGQPAMIYFMVKDKISAASITTSLILDYIACTLTNLFGFLIGFMILPRFIGEFSILSISLVIFDAVFLVIINIGLFFLLFNSKIFKKVSTGFFNFFNKIFHFKNQEEKIEKLNKTIRDYEQCSLIMKKNKTMVLKVFLYTFAQKLGKSLTTVFIFFAVIKEYSNGFKVWFIQVVSDLGASLVPIPGGIGAREYILIDGFSKLPVIESAANLGLICEAVSFYLGIIVSGLIVLFSFIISKKKEKGTDTK